MQLIAQLALLLGQSRLDQLASAPDDHERVRLLRKWAKQGKTAAWATGPAGALAHRATVAPLIDNDILAYHVAHALGDRATQQEVLQLAQAATAKTKAAANPTKPPTAKQAMYLSRLMGGPAAVCSVRINPDRPIYAQVAAALHARGVDRTKAARALGCLFADKNGGVGPAWDILHEGVQAKATPKADSRHMRQLARARFNPESGSARRAHQLLAAYQDAVDRSDLERAAEIADEASALLRP